MLTRHERKFYEQMGNEPIVLAGVAIKVGVLVVLVSLIAWIGSSTVPNEVVEQTVNARGPAFVETATHHRKQVFDERRARVEHQHVPNANNLAIRNP